MRFTARVLLALAAGVALGAFGPAPARALGIAPNPFGVLPGDAIAVAGSIELVAVVSGVPAGGSVVLGSVDPGDTTLVFRADVTASTSDALLLGIGPVAVPGSWSAFAGAGWIPGGGVDITSWTSIPGVAAFLPAGAAVNAGQSYDLVFLSYDTPPAEDGTLEVRGAFSYVPETLGAATIVPEPATALLLGGGLALLGGRHRSRA
jgi:hypothetical protein